MLRLKDVRLCEKSKMPKAGRQLRWIKGQRLIWKQIKSDQKERKMIFNIFFWQTVCLKQPMELEVERSTS